MNDTIPTPEHDSADEAARAFIARWRGSSASERANYQLFLAELTDLLGVERPRPSTAVAAGDAYAFERPVRFDDGEGRASSGFIDLYRRGSFVLEAKQGADAPDGGERTALGLDGPARKGGTARRGTRAWERSMLAAKEQARRYARALPVDEGWPPFLVVVDVGHALDLYADFSGQGKAYVPFPDPQRFRIAVEELTDPIVRERLRLVWTDPHALDPARVSARVTRDLAAKLARLAVALEVGEGAGHDPDRVASFLMRCLFSMFSEDVGLLPEGAFTGLLDRHRRRQADDGRGLDLLPDALADLWQTMDRGGYSGVVGDRVVQFNGKLFKDAEALALTAAQLDLLIEAGRADWAAVEPSIFGTLLERALDPHERHKLGAHYTPRAYVERLVVPALVEPLREEWAAAQAAAARREAEVEGAGKGPEAAEAAAREEVVRFHRRLCTVRVLDPACGSGNFLYVALEHLKRLEGEVLTALEGYGGQLGLDMTGGYTVSPSQLLGLEVNPRAAAIAEVVLWVGYLQWHLRATGSTRRLDPPLLRDYGNVRLQDAVLAYDGREARLDEEGRPVSRWDGRTTRPHPVTGEEVPDETAQVPVYTYTNPRPAVWPAADVILGNPPFIGGWMIRQALGDGYVEALWAAYPHMPQKADYVTYWWDRAAEVVRAGEAERFALITTNSIGQVFQRRVIQRHTDAEDRPLRLTFAIPDHPWVDSTSAAAVRIAMTVGERADTAPGPVLLGNVVGEGGDELEMATVGQINPDLSTGVNLDEAVPLKANAGLASPGVQLYGAGFIVSEEEAERLARTVEPAVAERVLRRYLNGRDLMAASREVRVIDFFGMSAEEAAGTFPAAYQHVLDRVKPERDQNRREQIRDVWWRFGWERPVWRGAVAGLPRFVVTPETAKHRVFVLLGAEVLPDNMLTGIALEDTFYFGVLQSRFHVEWSLAAGGTLEDRPRYTKSTVFDPFPFPVATEEQRERVRDVAERLDAHRKRVQAQHPDLTLTGLYNVLDRVRSGTPLKPAERDVYDRGLVGLLRDLHDTLDRAVADAYGWPADLPEPEVLRRLVALNRERSEEERAGLVRYLRPAFQNPSGHGQQGALAVGTDAKVAVGKETGRQPWPKELAARVQAVHRALRAEDRPAAPADLARRFERARAKDVEALLETLAALGQARRTEDGRYAA